jgi:hypothetical protein
VVLLCGVVNVIVLAPPPEIVMLLDIRKAVGGTVADNMPM